MRWFGPRRPGGGVPGALHRDLPYLAVQLPAQAFLAPDVTLRGQL